MANEDKQSAIKRILSEQDGNIRAAQVVVHDSKAYDQVVKAIQEVTRRKLVELFSEKRGSEEIV